ncbi:helix-turn-helix transcriptional regulator [Treponema sp. OMZ 799]|uniref:helix-turn-helix domain-containing protein n=1 Tax=Treponema sp. OMZ 799 TaxID=2563668 RepID=UPI0020A426D4|nr:helix-turn-helix transcriptional regulator [Treponema sp. OMZ 799]UTC77588.1 helix-turn-helix transcriptional regulator [Treponema sp. OMZ 799]
MTFNQRLKDLIKEKNLLQKEFAVKAGIKKRALDMYLGSRNSLPNVDLGVKIAKALDTTVEYLVTGEDSSLGLENPKLNKKYTRFINKLEILDDVDQAIVENLIDSLIDKKQSGASEMESSQIG